MLTSLEIKRNSEVLLKKQIKTMFPSITEVEELPSDVQEQMKDLQYKVAEFLLDVQHSVNGSKQ